MAPPVPTTTTTSSSFSSFSSLLSPLIPFLHELGLLSLSQSTLDIKIIILQRFFRFFAFGSSTIILALYLRSLSISESQIGLFLSLTLIGDLLSFGLTLLADGVGRRRVLVIGALLMTGSGVVFGSGVSGFVWVLVAGVVGIVSPNGREIGPFSAIEESTIAHLTPAPMRSDIFAWYTVIGSAGSSCGKLATGWTVQRLQTLKGWDAMQSYRAVFVAYSLLGILNALLACFLSDKVELERYHGLNQEPEAVGETEPETEPLLGSDARMATDSDETREKRSLLPRISRGSQAIIFRLCLLFAVDSLASGLVPASWVTYFFHIKFGLLEGELGSLFFATGLLSAFSSVLASSISKRIGLVNTMVFTHLPSAIALSLIPVPTSLPWAIFFLVLRSSMASMDIAPKAAFLSAVVLPAERTAVMGFVSVVRTFSQACGPLVTGVLAQAGKFWITFVVAGSLKAAYDLGLLALFKGHETHDDATEGRKKVGDEEGAENEGDRIRSSDRHV